MSVIRWFTIKSLWAWAVCYEDV